MQVILLESVEKLGKVGEIVKIADGYGRNYLIPRKKAIRATKQNIEFFEKQRGIIEQDNLAKKAAAEEKAKILEGLSIAIIRQAAEDGRLYGSVTSRDIANAINSVKDLGITYDQVVMNIKFKEIGAYEIPVDLHAEVKSKIILNIVRSTVNSEAAVA